MERDIVAEAKFVVKNGTTVRRAAEVFNISKSTLHKDITKRLKEIDYKLYEKVKVVLEKNKAERYSRGGKAKQEKIRKQKMNKES